MNTGSLHIIKATSEQVFMKSGYFENIMPSIRRCYDSKLIPFYFKYIPPAAQPDSVTKSVSLMPISIDNGEIIDGTEIEINETNLKAIDKSTSWVLYFNIDIPLSGIASGIYQYKIIFESAEYRSEPFLCCFDGVTSEFGAFSSAFSGAFDV